ncbi:MAG TPA: DUF6756 family protein [Puia sp.]|nr:DUF6756 family protein [Puia sp.]
MYWEEKIDLLAKKYGQTAFKVPFTDWPEIMKKIENSFIIKENANTHFSNWAGNIRQKIKFDEVAFNKLENYMVLLSGSIHYWVVIVPGRNPNEKHYVYDCKLPALMALIELCSGDFYIIDKKYQWLTYFNRDREANMVHVYKSGAHKIPFEK